MATILSFTTRQTYNQQRFHALAQPAREVEFQKRATDTLQNLGRFFKSTGYLDEVAEREYLQLASSIVGFSKHLAGATYHGPNANSSTETTTGQTTEDTNSTGIYEENSPIDPETAG